MDEPNDVWFAIVLFDDESAEICQCISEEHAMSEACSQLKLSSGVFAFVAKAIKILERRRVDLRLLETPEA